MFIAYFDESGHSAGTEFVSVGGFVADAEQWQLFDQRWNEALAANGAPYLHMREFTTTRDAFEGWDESRREALMAALVGVIASVDMLAAGAVLKVAEFRSFREEEQKAMRDPFYTLFQEAVAVSAVLAHFEPKETKVNLVWDRNTEFGGLAKDLYEVMRSTPHIENARMGTFSFANWRETPGLQAADLFSYELRKFYADLAEKAKREVRWPLQQILRGPAGNESYALVKFISREYMQLQLLGAVGSYQEARDKLLKLLGERFRQ